LILYVETSGAAKLLIGEQSSTELAAHLDRCVDRGDRLVSATLLETELRRMATRLDLPQADVTGVLDRFEIVQPDRAIYREAGLLPGRHLRSLDALHLATALRLGADAMVTYDHRQAAAARAVGLEVAAP
jgi:uncharacterized protein